MRSDAIGMFWEDLPSVRGSVVRVMPDIPDTGWRRPDFFPNLSTAPAISIDVETKDLDLLEKGPGWARNAGHIVGVSVGVPNGGRWYFPIRHEIEPEWNFPPEAVMVWLRDTLANRNQPKVGANLYYDIGWLKHEGVEVKGELVDVQFAEALLDERARVSLEHLGQKYLGEGKESNVLYQWCADYYGGKASSDQRKNIWRAPPRLVGPYAESDADLPLRVAKEIYPLLVREGLLDLFRMECDLIPLTIAMRFAGVSVNISAAEQLRDTLFNREIEAQKNLDTLAGFEVNIDAAANLAKLFDRVGLQYNRTLPTAGFPKGQPSFTKAFLKDVKHPVGKMINEIRKLSKLRGTFVESYILDSHIDGKVYGQFHQLRGDDGGTRSGRFSSSTPNLQNLPARDDELAPLIRGIFTPDHGHRCWRKYDYSQIEYRFLIHYATGPGADDARRLFCEHPETDYHDMTMDLVAPAAGWDVSTPELRKKERRPIKNINFGLIYGMGEEKLAGDLGMTRKAGKALFAAYHKGVPFAKVTMEAAMDEAQKSGVITTILNRKSRFDLWEPKGWNRDGIPLPFELALHKYGDIQRAMAHKALNRRLQGSAADLMKKAMWLSWTSGVYDRIGVPRLTVHDETDHSDPGGVDDGFAEMLHLFETAIKLRLPVKADVEVGPDWGHVK